MKQNLLKILRILKELFVLPFVADINTTLNFYSAILTTLPYIIKDKNLVAPHKKMWGKKCSFRVFGKKIIMDGKTFGYAGEIYIRKCYFPTRDFRINSDMTVVDLGAANGVFTVLAALSAKQVIAVEINKKSVEEIKKNAGLNHCLNKVITVWGAVGYKTGMSMEGMDSNVPKLEFEEILEKYKLKTVDLLKVDIEGSEFDLFRRNSDWLSKVKLITMEVHPECGNPEEIKNILKYSGFKVKLTRYYLFAKK
jgi:hypothetical protein